MKTETETHAHLAVLKSEWEQYKNEYNEGDAEELLLRGWIEALEYILKKDHSVYLLHVHDIDGAERYFDLPTATEFAEEFYSDDNGYYTAQKIELESEDEYKGFMKAFQAIETGNFDTLDISKHEYDEIKTVEENHA